VTPAPQGGGNRFSVLGTILKISIAVVLIWWMISSGRLNPRNLAGALRHWDLLLMAAGLIYGQIAITGLRWHLLLRSQKISLSLRDTLALNMIGTMFNTIIPGAVGGDVMKGYYLSRRAPTRRTLALTTLLVDRVLGVLGLLILSLIAALWNRDIAENMAMRTLLQMAAAAAAIGIVGFATAMLLGNRLLRFIQPFADRFRPVTIFSKVLAALTEYQHHQVIVLVSVVISVFNHLLSTAAFFLCARAITDAPIELSQFLFVVPLGLLTTAIPISPAGVGVGQAAFFTLFGLLPGLGGQLGSEACTLFQGVLVSVYLTGFIVYVFYRQEAARGQSKFPAGSVNADGDGVR